MGRKKAETPALQQDIDTTPAAETLETAATESDLVEQVEQVYLQDDPPEIRLAVETLSGDVRDAILERLRHEQDKRPWTERSEIEQRNTINRIDSMAQNLIRELCVLIAGEGQTSINAKIDSVTVKDEIKAVLTLPRHDNNRHALIDAQGARVLIIVIEAEKHIAERAPVRVSPDQADLIEQTEVQDAPAAEKDAVEGESDLVIGGLPSHALPNGSGAAVEHAAG